MHPVCLSSLRVNDILLNCTPSQLHLQILNFTNSHTDSSQIHHWKSQQRRSVSAENLPKDFSKIVTSCSTRTLLLVLCTMAAGSGTGCHRKLMFAQTDLPNDGVKRVVDEMTQSGRRLKEWTVPLTCKCHTFFSIHLFAYSTVGLRDTTTELNIYSI